ncbi:MAG: hypothetical protein C0591_04590 [Marinilabiliales bacterium]|jgi:hypothetical protein|nr:MAG: hypothetical protein C0591_04590 [Marinilabiliales bacterium]
MENSNCENCKLRAKYDAKPKSLLGRFWKWHIGFCPGWKSYITSLDEAKRNEVMLKYGKG